MTKISGNKSSLEKIAQSKDFHYFLSSGRIFVSNCSQGL